MYSCEVADDLLGNETVAKLEGEWSCDETSEIFKSTLEVYTVTISPDPDNVNGVIIDNFYNVGISVKANVSGRVPKHSQPGCRRRIILFPVQEPFPPTSKRSI